MATRFDDLGKYGYSFDWRIVNRQKTTVTVWRSFVMVDCFDVPSTDPKALKRACLAWAVNKMQ